MANSTTMVEAGQRSSAAGDTMQAQVLETFGSPVVLQSRPRPSVLPNEVLIRVHACGVCGSDLHLVSGEFGSLAKAPVIPGHEIAGVVEQAGAAVTKHKAGDRVGVGWTQHTCGECRYCARGETAVCLNQKITGIQIDGGWAQYVKATARDVVRIPDALSFEEAAPLFCAGLTTFSPFRLARFEPGSRVVVIGLGGLGHIAVQWARALGADRIAVARGADKIRLATSKLGADEGIDSSTEDWVKRVNAMGGADLILATANSAKLMSEAMMFGAGWHSGIAGPSGEAPGRHFGRPDRYAKANHGVDHRLDPRGGRHAPDRGHPPCQADD